MSVQMTLFAPETHAVTFVQVCHLCNEPICANPLDDVAGPWSEPILFAYVAQKQHERDAHGAPGLE